MEQGKQQVEIRVDETKMATTYANTIRTSTTPDELILDFGLNITGQSAPTEPVRMVFSVGSRVVMNWAGAKRLLASLQQAVGAYEQTFGTIDLNSKVPSSRPGGPGPGDPIRRA
jgi:hypothetical protein